MSVGELQSLDQNTRAGLPECVVSTMSGPLPETTQDRTQRTHTQPRTKIKILTPRESNPGRWVGEQGLTDHATAASERSHKSLNYYHFIPGRSGRFKRLLWTCTCRTKTVRFRTRVPIQKKLSIQSHLQALEVCNRNSWTLRIEDT